MWSLLFLFYFDPEPYVHHDGKQIPTLFMDEKKGCALALRNFTVFLFPFLW